MADKRTLQEALKAKTQTMVRGTPYQVGQMLPLDRIRTDGGTQARAGLDESTVAEYAQAMQDGATFPLIIVYHDGTDHWLADGFHRVAAAKRSEIGELRADVRAGTRRDAVLWAVGANDAHGLRRTRADVQRAIETLLRDEEWGQWGDREIGRQVHCDHKTVAAARARLFGEIPQIETRTVERGGTTYQQKAKQPAARVAPIDRRGEQGAGDRRRAYERAEAHDQALITEAAAAGSAPDPAKIQVATWQAEQARRLRPLDAARTFSTQLHAQMRGWAKNYLVRHDDFKAALDHIDALLALLEQAGQNPDRRAGDVD